MYFISPIIRPLKKLDAREKVKTRVILTFSDIFGIEPINVPVPTPTNVPTRLVKIISGIFPAKFTFKTN